MYMSLFHHIMIQPLQMCAYWLNWQNQIQNSKQLVGRKLVTRPNSMSMHIYDYVL